MQQSNDATPTYRGYRLQMLYSLSRILGPERNDHLIFQPETFEDLCIRDEKGNILEASILEAFFFVLPGQTSN